MGGPLRRVVVRVLTLAAAAAAVHAVAFALRVCWGCGDGVGGARACARNLRRLTDSSGVRRCSGARLALSGLSGLVRTDVQKKRVRFNGA